MNWWQLPDRHWYRNWEIRKMRDSFKSKAYAGEGELIALSRAQEADLGFSHISHVQAYVDKLTGSAWFERRWPFASRDGIEVNDGRARRSAYGCRGEIGLPRTQRHEAIILHEVAHAITWDVPPWHGPKWARAYLELVRRQMGDEAWRLLRDGFRKKNVRYTPYRDPRLSEHRRGAVPAQFGGAT